MACADAMLDVFVPESFDLVTGAAILHHLIDPSRALVAAHRALKPGGFAMFFEPFRFLEASSLPAWAQTIIAEAQSAFSETRSEMIFEGIVTIRKPCGAA